MLSFLRRLLAYRRAKPLDYSADEIADGDWPHVSADARWLAMMQRGAASDRGAVGGGDSGGVVAFGSSHETGPST